MKKLIEILLLLSIAVPSSIHAQQAQFTAIPKKYKLYPRDANDSASVAISGSINAAGFDSVTVVIYKDGVLYRHAAQSLVYANGSASFAFSPKIHAELSNYKFEIRANTGLIGSADSVTCGDAYLIGGQSNAVCFASWNYTNPWVRSFGNCGFPSDVNTPIITADTAWGIGQCNSFYEPNNFPSPPQWHCAIGVWGMQVAKHIVEDHGIPVCVINGAVGGSNISEHQRSMNINTAYGAAYYRLSKSGLLTNGLKAIFWAQGETDAIDAYRAGLYKAGFSTLYNSWKSDYPSVKHYYVFQIRPAAGAAEIVCEALRTTPQGRTDLSVMSTSNVPGYGGLHYGYTGYQEFGHRIYRLVNRDLFGSTDTMNINAPDIISAAYSDGTHTRLVLQFNQAVLLPGGVDMKRYFALDTTHSLIQSAISDTSHHTVTIVLQSFSSAATVSCLPGGNYPNGGVATEGPWITNPRGISALSFYNVPITGASLVNFRQMPASSNGILSNREGTIVTIQLAGNHQASRFNTIPSNGFGEVFSLNGKVMPYYLIKADNESSVKNSNLSPQTLILKTR